MMLPALGHDDPNIRNPDDCRSASLLTISLARQGFMLGLVLLLPLLAPCFAFCLQIHFTVSSYDKI